MFKFLQRGPLFTIASLLLIYWSEESILQDGNRGIIKDLLRKIDIISHKALRKAILNYRQLRNKLAGGIPLRHRYALP